MPLTCNNIFSIFVRLESYNLFKNIKILLIWLYLFVSNKRYKFKFKTVTLNTIIESKTMESICELSVGSEQFSRLNTFVTLEKINTNLNIRNFWKIIFSSLISLWLIWSCIFINAQYPSSSDWTNSCYLSSIYKVFVDLMIGCFNFWKATLRWSERERNKNFWAMRSYIV